MNKYQPYYAKKTAGWLAINPHPKSLSQRKRDFESGSPLPKGEEVRETLRRRLVEIDHP